MLRNMFDKLAKGGVSLKDIPPIFVFQNTGEERDVRFIGLAVPGVRNVHEDEYFGTVWRSNKRNIRFPNYIAKFTVLDLGEEVIRREWLESLIYHPSISDSFAPKAWKNFVNKGLAGIKALEAPVDIHWPGKSAQMPDDDGMKILSEIHKRFGKKDPTGFERLCKKLLFMTDPNYMNISLTRPVRDGGRDAVMEYKISAPTNSVIVECAMEAKCFNPRGKKSIGVKETSRLISRIKNRQFGVMMTTSYIGKQAYEEIKEDGHPIMFFTGKDIVEVLRQKANVTSKNISSWLDDNCE